MMMVCPVCETEVPKESQEYCLSCAWEFEYFFDELEEKQFQKYESKLSLYKKIYQKSTKEYLLTSLQIERTKYIEEISFLKKEIRKLKEKNNFLNDENILIKDKLDGIKKSFHKKRITIINGLMYQNQYFTEVYTWEEALTYAKELRLGGYSDWRLPSIHELKVLLLEEKKEKKFIKESFYLSIPIDYAWFWSSTEYTNFKDDNDTSEAWNINFTDGHLNYSNKLYKLYVLCVRG